MPTLNKSKHSETFYIDSRGFLYLKLYRQNYYNQLTLEKLNEYIGVISNMCNKTTSSILVDVRDIFGVVRIDHDCLDLLAKDIRLKKVCKKVAFLTNSLPLALKIRNYITKYHPTVHTRVFNHMEEGIDFCKN